MEPVHEKILMLVIYAIVTIVLRYVADGAGIGRMTNRAMAGIMNTNVAVKVALMAAPEQVVLQLFEPMMPFMDRGLITLCMLGTRSIWYGSVGNAANYFTTGSASDALWIFATALYSMRVIGVRMSTVTMMVLADCGVLLALNGSKRPFGKSFW